MIILNRMEISEYQHKSNPQINIVVPLFNEEEVLDSLITRLDNLIKTSNLSIEILFVDDGSTDRSPEIIEELSLRNDHYHSIILSRNFGHQLAITAGLINVTATEAVLIIDGDLQDPPEVLDMFYNYLQQGYEVVYAIRKGRKESFFKRICYKAFYSLLKKTSHIEIPPDTGDFSLISRRAVDQLNTMPEENRFMRGLRSWIGFKQIGIEINRDSRSNGKPKYSYKKLLELALNGLFNFSIVPLKFIFSIGIGTIVVSLIYFCYTLVLKLFYDATPQGFTSLLFTIILFGGIQLVSLGLIGSYVIRIFFQVKNRPLFVIKKRIRDGKVYTS